MTWWPWMDGCMLWGATTAARASTPSRSTTRGPTSGWLHPACSRGVAAWAWQCWSCSTSPHHPRPRCPCRPPASDPRRDCAEAWPCSLPHALSPRGAQRLPALDRVSGLGPLAPTKTSCAVCPLSVSMPQGSCVCHLFSLFIYSVFIHEQCCSCHFRRLLWKFLVSLGPSCHPGCLPALLGAPASDGGHSWECGSGPTQTLQTWRDQGVDAEQPARVGGGGLLSRCRPPQPSLCTMPLPSEAGALPGRHEGGFLPVDKVSSGSCTELGTHTCHRSLTAI